MSIKDIVRKHTVRHKGDRKVQTTDVVLRPYKKNGFYQVAKSGAGNTTMEEIPCRNLKEVARYLDEGGYLVRMKSESPKVEGLYAARDIEVIR